MSKYDRKDVVYVVKSATGEETRRTARDVAEQDVEIIKTILGRSAWIEEEAR